MDPTHASTNESSGDSSNGNPVYEATLALPESASSSTDRLLQSKFAVLAMLFLVTGALGIPLLWSNKRFSPTERKVWAIVVSIYTITLLLGTTAICYWSYRKIIG